MLRAHHDVGTTISLTQRDGDLGHRSFTEGVEELSTMDDNPVVFLTRTWEEAWDVYEGNKRDVEGVTEADEASSLTRSIAVKGTCHDHRLVSDDTDALTVEASEADDDVLSPVTVYFEELTMSTIVPMTSYML